MRESLSGDFALLMAPAPLAAKDNTTHLEIQQPSHDGEPFLVTAKNTECPEFKLIGGWLFPQKPCDSIQFRVAADPANGFVFQHFSLDVTNLPAPAKIAEFGDVRILSFRTEGDFQTVSMPGETQPYLLPKQVITSVATNKGKIVITNQYSVKLDKSGAQR